MEKLSKRRYIKKSRSNTMAKILISVCGIGSGHASRSLRIARYLVRKGFSVAISCYGDAVNYFTRLGYKVNIDSGLSFYWRDGALSKLNSIAISIFRWRSVIDGFHKLAQYIKYFSPDVIISDSRITPLFLARKYHIPSILITNQLSVKLKRHDNSLLNEFVSSIVPKIWSIADEVAIADLPPPYTLTRWNNLYSIYKSSLSLSKVKFIGPIGYNSNIKLYKSLSSKYYDIFLFLSGPRDDRRGIMLGIIKLAKLLSRKYKIVVSLGDPELSHIIFKSSRIECYGWVKDPLYFLRHSKLAITRGGYNAIIEAILSSTPLVIMPALNQTEQMENANQVVKLGIGKYVYPNFSVYSVDTIYKRILQLSYEIFDDYNSYIRNIERMKQILMRYNGLENIYRLVNNLI